MNAEEEKRGRFDADIRAENVDEVFDWVEEQDLVSAPFPGALCVEVVVTVPSESGWVDGGV